MNGPSGGALYQGKLITWGSELVEWSLPGLVPTKLGEGDFRAGCAFQDGLALQAGGRLIYWNKGQEETIDTGAAVVDMLEAELFGRRGLLVIHHGMQLRFYERPEAASGRWPYREIYSFYTASEQGGLLLHDVDGDGRPDILCGNYWVQAPVEFDLPWRLFAINLFHEHPLSASARLAWVGGRLLWVESKRPDARVVWFTPSSDRKQLWLGEAGRFDPPLQYPRALLVHGDEIWIGEENGAESRLMTLPSKKVLRRGIPLHTLLAWQDRVIGIGPNTAPIFLDGN